MTEMLESIKSDLLSRRMLPLLVGVAVALVGAAAYALSAGGSSGGASPSPAPSTALPPVASTMHVAVASVNPHAALAETPGGKRYQSHGSTRNPFAPLTPPPSAKSGTTGPSGSSSGSSSAGSPSNSGAVGGSSTGSTPGASAPPTPVLPKPKPVHAGLASDQSYSASLSLTTTAGGLDTIDSLKRLGVLPSAQQPLLVYLGVLKGGRDALFVVQPGTVVSGPGVCLPGPADCEILSLAQEQIESLAVSTGSGSSNVALFAVNAITVEGHSSVAASNRARREVSAAGHSLLAASTLPALPLFEYQPHVGAVVDLRSLAVGGK